jgi:hypothetical protein
LVFNNYTGTLEVALSRTNSNHKWLPHNQSLPEGVLRTSWRKTPLTISPHARKIFKEQTMSTARIFYRELAARRRSLAPVR